MSTGKKPAPFTEPVKFRRALTAWFRKNARPLPWRNNSHWYPVFLSEFLLQQTQVDQALPYYHKFIGRYPNITELAKADEQEVLTMWTGLGYYARARNMLKAARILHNEYKGQFPGDRRSVLALPGIGPYTAAAILSIAFDEPLPVIDGNVIRVITRINALTADTRQRNTIKKIEDICTDLIDRGHPGRFNEALMELGALVCRPQNPDCRHCPLRNFCIAGREGIWHAFPVKSPPAPKKKRREIVFIVREDSKLLIAKRPARGLLASMWEFPAAELAGDSDINKFVSRFSTEASQPRQSEIYRHIYTHIDLFYSALLINYPHTEFIEQYSRNPRYQDYRPVTKKELTAYPIHNAHKKLLKWLSEIESE